MLNSTVATPVSSTRSIARSERIRLTRAATGLKPAEKLLLRSLVDFMGNTIECWPSLSRLADEVGVTVRHVRRMLRSLEAAGWIVTRSRFRPDRSQTSCVFQWVKAPDLHVRPPRTSVSALELNIGSIQESNTYAAPAECDFEQEQTAPVAAELANYQHAGNLKVDASFDGPKQGGSNETPSHDSSIELPAAPAIEGTESNLPASSAVLSPSKPAIPAAPAIRSSKLSPKFIVIDGAKFLDINHGKDIYLAAVAGKLLNSGTADRLAFFACWCAIAGKLRAGTVRAPERMMRFLLDNRKAMSAYPDHAAEQKARAAVRHLWPDKPYNPHG
jgi:hypothetical protein